MRPYAIAAAALIAFVVLVTGNVVSTSPTYDETTHLVSGLSYWRTGDFRLNPEHPPLIKMLAALPLLPLEVWPWRRPSDGALTRGVLDEAWAMALINVDAQWRVSDYALYGLKDDALRELGASPLNVPTTTVIPRTSFLNDPETMFLRARLAVATCGVVVALLVFLWSRELWGAWGGVVSVVLFAFDPNFIAHAGLVTTDVAVSLFIFGTVYFFWRWSRNPSFGNAAAMVIACALAVITKFSAVVLAPILIVLAVSRPRRARSVLVGGLALAVSFLAIWSAYRFRYSAATDPTRAAQQEEAARASLRQPHLDAPPAWPRGHFPLRDVVEEWSAKRVVLKSGEALTVESLTRARRSTRLGVTQRVILYAAEHRLLPEAYLFGASWVGSKSVNRASYLRGEYSDTGFRSFYFWSMLYKLPIATLIAIVIGIALALRARATPFLIWPVVLYLAVALASNLNIGHRHILPIFPFVYVACGALVSLQRTRLTAALLIAIAVTSNLVLLPKPAPMWARHLSYLNEIAGGPERGFDELSDSNFDWGQDLERLAEWLRGRQIREPLQLVYFGTADPRWYQLAHRNLRPLGAASASRGLLAISSIDYLGVALPPEQRHQWRTFLSGRRALPVARIGYSIFVYEID